MFFRVLLYSILQAVVLGEPSEHRLFKYELARFNRDIRPRFDGASKHRLYRHIKSDLARSKRNLPPRGGQLKPSFQTSADKTSTDSTHRHLLLKGIGRRRKVGTQSQVLDKNTIPLFDFLQWFTTDPQDVNVTIGERWVLNCSVANSKRNDTVSWYKNGIKHKTVALANNAYNLNRSKARVEDEGSYQCIFGDEAHKVSQIKSRNATLIVLVPCDNPTINNGVATVEVENTEEAIELVCEANNRKLPPTILWLQNSNPVKENIRNEKTLSNSSKLWTARSTLTVYSSTFNNPDLTFDTGIKYTCDASHECDSSELKLSSVRLKRVTYFPPSTVTISGAEGSIKVNSKVKLTCVTSKSNPKASVIWLTNGNTLTGAIESYVKSGGGYITTSVLSFQVTEVNSKITCRASNAKFKDTVPHDVTLKLERPTLSDSQQHPLCRLSIGKAMEWGEVLMIALITHMFVTTVTVVVVIQYFGPKLTPRPKKNTFCSQATQARIAEWNNQNMEKTPSQYSYASSMWKPRTVSFDMPSTENRSDFSSDSKSSSTIRSDASSSDTVSSDAASSDTASSDAASSIAASPDAASNVSSQSGKIKGRHTKRPLLADDVKDVLGEQADLYE